MIPLLRLQLSFQLEFQPSQLHAFGLGIAPRSMLKFMVSNSHDWMMSKQVKHILENFHGLLAQLRRNFRDILKSKKDFEKSLSDNEDGFFLSLFKLISDAQLFVQISLTKYFWRKR